MTSQDRTDYVNKLRKQVRDHPDREDPLYPSATTIRHGVACLRLMRAGAAKGGARSTKKPAVVPKSLDDFA